MQMLVAGWDAGMADDQPCDGAAATRLERPTLLVVDDADLRTGLIARTDGIAGRRTPHTWRWSLQLCPPLLRGMRVWDGGPVDQDRGPDLVA